MLEAIGIAVFIHLGKTVIDRFWGAQRTGSTAVVDQSGKLEYTAPDAGRTVVHKEFTVHQRQESVLLFGNFYLMDTLQELLVGDEVPLGLDHRGEYARNSPG